MKAEMERRQFLQMAGLGLSSVAAAALSGRSVQGEEAPKRIRKALGWSMLQEKIPVEEKLRVIKEAGFDGIEVSRSPGRKPDAEPAELARAAAQAGVIIHGVSNGANTDLEAAIDDAALYGATSVLHVVRADAKAPFFENYRRTQELIRSAIPRAEEKKVKILLENVWATFLIEPLSMARYIDEIGSPWVKAYFDVGNVMRWGWPQHWIEVLGPRIEKIHIKEYSLSRAMKEGMSKGFDLPIGSGEIDWKQVRAELAKISFSDWATAEVRGGDRKRIAEIAAEMDGVLFPAA